MWPIGRWRLHPLGFADPACARSPDHLAQLREVVAGIGRREFDAHGFDPACYRRETACEISRIEKRRDCERTEARTARKSRVAIVNYRPARERTLPQAHRLLAERAPARCLAHASDRDRILEREGARRRQGTARKPLERRGDLLGKVPRCKSVRLAYKQMMWREASAPLEDRDLLGNRLSQRVATGAPDRARGHNDPADARAEADESRQSTIRLAEAGSSRRLELRDRTIVAEGHDPIATCAHCFGQVSLFTAPTKDRDSRAHGRVHFSERAGEFGKENRLRRGRLDDHRASREYRRGDFVQPGAGQVGGHDKTDELAPRPQRSREGQNPIKLAPRCADAIQRKRQCRPAPACGDCRDGRASARMFNRSELTASCDDCSGHALDRRGIRCKHRTQAELRSEHFIDLRRDACGVQGGRFANSAIASAHPRASPVAARPRILTPPPSITPRSSVSNIETDATLARSKNASRPISPSATGRNDPGSSTNDLSHGGGSFTRAAVGSLRSELNGVAS